MNNIENIAEDLIKQRDELNALLSSAPNMPAGNCKYYLFCKKYEAMFSPFWLFYEGISAASERDKICYFRSIHDGMQSGESLTKNILQAKIQNSDVILAQLSWFKVQLREFVFTFASPDCHDSYFKNWDVRSTPRIFIETAASMTHDIILSICSYAGFEKKLNRHYPALPEVKSYLFDLLRQNLFTDYKCDAQSYREIAKNLHNIDRVLAAYAQNFQIFLKNIQHHKNFQSILDYYQIGTMNEDVENIDFLKSGIEIEFQVPGSRKDLSDFSQAVCQSGCLKSISPSQNKGIYEEMGVMAVDESLPDLNGYYPVEYATAILKEKKDAARIRYFMDFLKEKKCGVDQSCGVHIHISAENQSLDTHKVIVLRYARYERIIRFAFFSHDRQENLNPYGPSLLSLYGKNRNTIERTKSYLLMTHFVHKARNIDELYDAVSCSGRYTSLFIKTKYDTIEFRGHPGTLCSDRITGYFNFVQDFVLRAVNGNTAMISLSGLRQGLRLRLKDKTQILIDPLYAPYKSNEFDMTELPGPRVMEKIMAMNERVSKKIIETGKLPHPVSTYEGQLYRNRDYSQDIRSRA